MEALVFALLMRTYIYIDGFNLYHRALKDTQYKWLDLKKLCVKLLKPYHVVSAIKYFTAKVAAMGDPDRPLRQRVYIRALEHYIPELQVFYGHFLSHEVTMPLARPRNPQKRFVRVIKTEEKGSDVNLAVHLLNDAWLDRYDCAVILSNDSDLAASMRLVKNQCGKMVGLILPNNCNPARELIGLADFVKKIRKGVLSESRLPETIPGTKIYKPPNW